MSDLYLVADGGGSKTETLLFSGKGQVYGYGYAGASNPLSAGHDEAVSNVTKALSSVFISLQGMFPSRTVLYIPGFEACRDMLPDTILRLSPEYQSDEYSAYFSCLDSPGGIILLAGTGSFASGRTPAGTRINAGGWGHLLGDGGSGYDIGRRAIQFLLSRRDDMLPLSPLDIQVLEKLKARDSCELIRQVYQAPNQRSLIASLCPVVGREAMYGNEEAIRILHEAAQELAKLVLSVANIMDGWNGQVGFTGGVSKLQDLIMVPISNAIRTRYPHASLVKAKYAPLVGAAMHLLHEINGRPAGDTTGQALQNTYENLQKMR